MYRRNFLSIFPASLAAALSPAPTMEKGKQSTAATPDNQERQYWVRMITKIADPVLTQLALGHLKKTMPVETHPSNKQNRASYTHLEAFARLMAGIAPWLELGIDNTQEGRLRAKYIALARKAVAMATDPGSQDYMRFTGPDYDQAIVDTAFLAHAFLRAPEQLWKPLDAAVKANVIKAFRSARAIRPHYNNWLLFMAMIETFLLKTGEGADMVRIEYAVKKHLEWYKGDGIYGDGENLHYDYYNSFVIHPMLIDILKVQQELGKDAGGVYKTVLARGVRYAALQERMISPEGTFPVTGRSLAYRFGAFQALAQICLMRQLPEEILPAQVRGALSAVISRMIEAPGTFDKDGWLTIGFAGHQPTVAEPYISTGSLYLCTTGMLTLGLPPTDAFWTAPAAPWTSVQAWKGLDFGADHAIGI